MSTTGKLRAAIYARYSSDMQSEASIEDQIRICQRLIEARDWDQHGTYHDRGISGATALRPGYQDILRDARSGAFDVVVAESLDRISRDQEHIAAFYKSMAFQGIPVVTVAEGEISEMHIGLKGTMSALFLKDLAQKTHRGLEGRVRAGKSAGGVSYGYSIVRQARADGSLTTGDRVPDPEQAAVVHRIFVTYANGASARTIARELNREGVPAPRAGNGKGSGTWSFSTITGNWKRGTGILNNELYIGRMVWNRQRFLKDPVTGRRQARPNPPEAWIIEDVPHLRLIDDELWYRVKRRQGAMRDVMAVEDRTNAFGAARRPTYLFSKLLTCGCCGASYTLMNKTKYGCSASRNRGTCDNRKLIQREEVEARVLDGLRDQLMHPDLVAAFVEEYHLEWNRLQADGQVERKRLTAELAKVAGQIDRLIAAVMDGMSSPSMKTTMSDLETRKAELEQRLEALGEEETPVRLHPGLTDVYKRKLADLTRALNDPEGRVEATDILRSLITEIRLIPEEAGHAVEIVGDLAGILAVAGGGTTTPRGFRHGVSDSMVAGVGFEPTTFRL